MNINLPKPNINNNKSKSKEKNMISSFHDEKNNLFRKSMRHNKMKLFVINKFIFL